VTEASPDRPPTHTASSDEPLALPSQLLAARLKECRATARKPDGSTYTLQEVADGVKARTRSSTNPKGTGSRQYMWELEEGRSRTPGKGPPKPGADVLRALADFFGKPPGYFLATSRDHAEALEAQVEVYEALTRLGTSEIAARSFAADGWARDPATSSGDATPPPADAATLRGLAATLNHAADLMKEQLSTLGQPPNPWRPPFSADSLDTSRTQNP
jgi:transcriptional regulator with XRE-family HTH domain